MDETTIATLEQIAACISRNILHNRPAAGGRDADAAATTTTTTTRVVISGAGTSGRMAFVCASTFNRVLEKLGLPKLFAYICAGGDSALFTSQEAPEDNWRAGIQTLVEASQNASKVVYIGITCGLAAPFVAAQLDYCMQHLDVFTPVLLGFNPLHLARRIKVEQWHHTFASVCEQLVQVSFPQVEAAKAQGFILTPIVGPEPITGSTRMKGGSATKIILDVMFVRAFQLAKLLGGGVESADQSVAALLQECLLAMQETYLQARAIGQVVQLAGDSLRSGGRILYLGSDSLGIMGLIDASECAPTYGATYDDVRGFLHGCFDTLGNVEGNLHEKAAPAQQQLASSPGPSCATVGSATFDIGLGSFTRNMLPTLSPRDLVIAIVSDNPSGRDAVYRTLEAASGRGSKTAVIACTGASPASAALQLPASALAAVRVRLQRTSPISDGGLAASAPIHLEFAAKLVCNAITTGAHVLRGKVLGNHMIDLRVSNTKLFHRAIGIISRFANVDEAMARDSLVRSIHTDSSALSELANLDISEHVRVATTSQRVVPRAIVLAIAALRNQNLSAQAANAMLDSHPIVRDAVRHLLNPSRP
ncbi:glucokinase regulatory protein, variant 1 [Capsaspora owczarzaki ATCC 30864]|nr:glucokinase regulatory protein, variant 1 [Capsaspora owczarzaki ATCC 30864]